MLAVIKKEWLLLAKDKMALLTLFIMPMFFVLIISLLQNGSATQSLTILVHDQDNSALSQQLVANFSKDKRFHIVKVENLTQATQQIASGQQHVLIAIPKNAGEQLQHYTKQGLLKNAKPIAAEQQIQVLLDPAMPNLVRQSFMQNLQLFIASIKATSASKAIADILGTTPAKPNAEPVIPLQVHYANASQVKPNAVQQNVPAWSLFGMFFIVIPLSVIIIRERASGVMKVIALAPIAAWQYLLGRVVAFVGLNLLQLFFMLLIGIIVLPWFGLPQLSIAHHWLAILAIGLSASVAAIGFGLLMGSWMRSYEQALSLGPILIVIAAALGGIMLPSYLLPDGLRAMSQYSPLNWGQQAFLAVLVRDMGFSGIMVNLAKLWGFFFVTAGLAWWKTKRLG